MTQPLMEYLPPVQANQGGGAGKYFGEVAAGYDAKRENSPKFTIEQRIIEDMLSDMPQGTRVLDCPVGTGRFLPFYVRKGFKFLGVDLQGDMLIQAAMKLGADKQIINQWIKASQKAGQVLTLETNDGGKLAQGDCRHLLLPDKSVDATVNCRITRWLSPGDCTKMLQEMQRVCMHRIIVTARVRNHVHARTYELINGALNGWCIHRDETGVDMDYRILELRPV